MIFTIRATHQVRSTNANVHNISDGFTTEAFPLSTAHSLQKYTHTLTQLTFVLYALCKKSKLKKLLTWQKPFIFSRTLFTSGMTSFPSTRTGVLARFLRATWRTARPCSHTQVRINLYSLCFALISLCTTKWGKWGGKDFIFYKEKSKLVLTHFHNLLLTVIYRFCGECFPAHCVIT